jgi:hypothetical protein
MPNLSRENETKLVVHMWGSKNYCISVPIKYDCQVADVVCTPSKVDIKFCFINYVYDRKIVLKNNSDLPGHFTFMPLEVDGINVIYSEGDTVCFQKDEGLVVTVTVPTNYIPPLGEVEIPLTIETPMLGLQEVPL